MNITKRKVDDLIPYARNSRTHSDTQIAAIAASIREYGFLNPVLVRDDGTIVAGHGRVMAARKLGMTEVPCFSLSHLNDAQSRAYVIADNKLAEQAGWNDEILKMEVAEIIDGGFDAFLMGFNQDELDELLADVGTIGNTDPDDAPDVPSDPVSKIGDVWVLNKHRIICGSCTDADTVSKLLNGVSPHLMVTDPPYGVMYDADWRNKAIMVKGEKAGEHGSRAVGKVMNDDRADWREAWELFTGDVAYIWHAGVHSPTVAASLEVCGFEMRALVIWAKSQLVIGRGHYHHMHEPCWYAVKKSGTGHWSGDRKQTTLWKIDKPPKSETGHSTQKPVECMRRPIENNSSPGQAIYDPFLGSGTTVIAAEQTGRSCYAIELNPAYIDVAVTRWQNFTGGGAVLEGDGRSFAEIATSGR